MLLSIVIPTKDRPYLLKKTLDSLSISLEEISYEFEIFVVDDSSREGNLLKNKKIVSHLKKVSYLRNVCVNGASSARNLGIKRSSGKWIAFLDDDVIVSDKWAENLIASILHMSDDIVGVEGAVIPLGKGLWDDDVKNINGGLYLTANMAYRKDILEKVNGFNKYIVYWAEDHDIAARILFWGEIIFNKELVVFHSPRRVNYWNYFTTTFERMRNYTNSEYIFFINNKETYRNFRYFKSFWETAFNFVFKNTYLKLMKRGPNRLLKNPISTIYLVLVSLLEQIAVLFFLPKYFFQSFSAKPILTREDDKVIWIASNISSSSFGGVGRVMHEFGTAFKESDYSVKLIYSDHKIVQNYILFSFSVLLRFLFSVNKPSVVIARSTDIFFLSLAQKVFNMKVKTVLHSHGWEEQVYELEKSLGDVLTNNRTTMLSPLIRFPMLRLSLKFSDATAIGTIDGMRFLLNKYPRYFYKIVLLPNAVSKEKISSTNIKRDNKLFISVANSSWKKGLHRTIKIFKKLHKIDNDYKLFCLGTGLSKEEFCKKFNIYDVNIKNFSSVDFDSMKIFYKQASYIIVSSLYEGGHSLALLEAMSFGVVPFVSDIKSNKEIIRDGINGFILKSGSELSNAVFINEVIKKNLLNRERVSHISNCHRWFRNVKRLESFLCIKD